MAATFTYKKEFSPLVKRAACFYVYLAIIALAAYCG
jgi:hypothetical protein